MLLRRRSIRRAVAAAAVAALAATGCGGAEPGAGRTGGDTSAGPHFQAAGPPPAPPRGRWLTARLRHPAILRARPGGRRLARLRVRTEFGSPLVLSVIHRRGGWLAVPAPELRNGRLGWVPASAVRLGSTNLSIHVDRSARRLRLRDGARVVQRMPVAVGRLGNSTPTGRFAVTDRLRTTAADSPYGCCAIALTGHQPDLPAGWPGGDRLAIHATSNSSSIGQAASLGCMRAPTGAVRTLMRRVPLGTPVFVRE
jgi:hypothetical protein